MREKGFWGQASNETCPLSHIERIGLDLYAAFLALRLMQARLMRPTLINGRTAGSGIDEELTVILPLVTAADSGSRLLILSEIVPATFSTLALQPRLWKSTTSELSRA